MMFHFFASSNKLLFKTISLTVTLHKQGFHPNYSSLYKIVCLCVCVHAFLHTYFGVLRDVRLKMQRFKSSTVLSLIVTGTFTNFD